MADPIARQHVLALREQGWSGARIARALGRDAGMVNQIARDARGSGYGRALRGALGQLASGRAPEPPPRRVTSAGRQARVRRPVVRTPAGTVTQAARGGASQLRQLRGAAQRGQNVTGVVAFGKGRIYGRPAAGPGGADPVDLALWSRGGWSAQSLLAAVDLAGGGPDALNQVITDQANALGHVENVSDVQSLSLTFFD